MLQGREKAKEKGLTEEKDIEREVRLYRIRKVAGLDGKLADLTGLPSNIIERQYILDSAKQIRDSEDSNRLPDDKAMLRRMLDRGWDAVSCVDALVKLSPSLPKKNSLLAVAESYKPERIAAQASR